MGVLDDAIREHLDLKRRRGADPAEVEKQASEALGPARREPPAEPALDPEEPAAEETLVVPAEAAADVAADPVEPPADVPEAEPPTQLAEELAPPAEPPAPADVTPLHPVEQAPPPATDDALSFTPVDDPPEPDEVPSDERLADEAPLDFPSEKRGDDSLWFEQSPRRDSDFDD